MIRAQGLTVGYGASGGAGPSTVASSLDLELHSGELVCLLGPNGAGKSTLLRTLAGLLRPLGGRIFLGDELFETISPRRRARHLAVVLTDRQASSLLTARELVQLGRYPHTGWSGRLAIPDHEAVERALEEAGALELASRLVAELSDGERQKVMVARALAQEPEALLLDEATAFLDLPRRVELMSLLRRQAREGKAILLSTHDLDLALRSADRLWLLSQEGALRTGLPEELVLSGAFGSTFDAEGVVFDPTEGAFQIGAPHRGAVVIEGPEGLTKQWTARAVRRLGFSVARPGDQAVSTIRIGDGEPCRLWTVEVEKEKDEIESLERLVDRMRRWRAPAGAVG